MGFYIYIYTVMYVLYVGMYIVYVDLFFFVAVESESRVVTWFPFRRCATTLLLILSARQLLIKINHFPP